MKLVVEGMLVEVKVDEVMVVLVVLVVVVGVVHSGPIDHPIKTKPLANPKKP